MGPENLQRIDDSRRLVPHTGKGRAFPNMASLRLGMFGIFFALGLLPPHPTMAAQELEYGKEATIDQHGNIYVSSDEGKQTDKIKPGMQRKDPLKLFTTEGGLSTVQAQRYVLIECPYIKVDVGFKAGSNGSNEDIIESVSRPYLEWGIAD